MVTSLVNFLSLFRTISRADAEMIASFFSEQSCKEGDVLFRSGDVCKKLFFICTGILKIVRPTEKGKEMTYFFLKENQFSTILRSFNQQTPADEGIVAACDAQIVVISRDKLLALYEQLPYLKELIDQIIQQGLLDKIQTRNAYHGEDSTTRYNQFLIRQPDIALRVSLSDIASYLGITQQSLSRIRRNVR